MLAHNMGPHPAPALCYELIIGRGKTTVILCSPVIKLRDDNNRAKGFFLGDKHVIFNISKYGRLEEIPWMKKKGYSLYYSVD